MDEGRDAGTPNAAYSLKVDCRNECTWAETERVAPHPFENPPPPNALPGVKASPFQHAGDRQPARTGVLDSSRCATCSSEPGATGKGHIAAMGPAGKGEKYAVRELHVQLRVRSYGEGTQCSHGAYRGEGIIALDVL